MIPEGEAPWAPAWTGQFADGVTAEVRELTVTREGDELVGRPAGTGESPLRSALRGGAEGLRWPRERVSRRRLGDGRDELVCADAPDASLTLPSEAAEALLRRPGRARADGGRGRRGRLALAYGCSFLAVAGLLYAGATPIARLLARRVPRAAEAQLGQGMALLLEKQYCETPDARATLSRMARRLGGDPDVAVHVMDTTMVNAFTLPGGVVVVTRGLLDEAQSPDEVAGVLAHELEHVARRHVMVHMIRGSILTALWQASVGDYSGFFVVDPKTALDIASLSFSRDDEREADRGALARLKAAGIRPDGFAQFFDRMRAKTDAIPAWLSNHPSSAERVATIARGRAAPGSQTGAPPALAAGEWASLHNDACAPASAGGKPEVTRKPDGSVKPEPAPRPTSVDRRHR